MARVTTVGYRRYAPCRWEAEFNTRQLVAELKDKEIVVTDQGTGDTIEGEELHSFLSLLTYHRSRFQQQHGVQVTELPTLWTMRRAHE